MLCSFNDLIYNLRHVIFWFHSEFYEFHRCYIFQWSLQLTLKLYLAHQFSSVQFSHSVMSNSLWPHESQYTRPPCLSPTPRVHSNSCPSSQWCHPAISSSVIPFSSCPQSLPASGSFPMSQLFAWGGQSTGASALALFLPKKSQDWSPLGWTSRVFSNTSLKASILPAFSFLHIPALTSIHDHKKNHSLD